MQFIDEDEPDDVRALKRIGNQFPELLPQNLEPLCLLRGMRDSLDEEEFRWGALHDYTPQERRQLRRERLHQYWQYLEVFNLEIDSDLAHFEEKMAVHENWSSAGAHFGIRLRIARQRLNLRLAGMLYRLGLPGAADVCDAAAYRIFNLVYLPGPPAV